MHPQRLILLPGWAIGPRALAPLVESLEQAASWLEVETPTLPPYGHARPEVWLEALGLALGLDDSRQDPRPTWIGGWSLGGMLAVALAARRPERFAGVIGLGANARFLSASDWPQAMRPATFQRFASELEHSPHDTLHRFGALAAQGSRDTRRLARVLVQALLDVSLHETRAGLKLLRWLDNRTALSTLTLPQLYLFAEHDALVPFASQREVQRLCTHQATCMQIENAGHAFVIDQAALSAERIEAFIAANSTGRER
ncbi:alpha/beta fold hydrolase [Halotalea alkalilenta]|uniref:AB hydrolase-1 domain-containing protein n=1 Tax=Halotalea alkalilenta TaxID=376489 RepID=A0A172YEV7_9GAMM|nr:alpha/beta fold hydrolase [Halotalea alkalilenta]ANF57754.1 hypothetical protein A5892_09990 [Halotalea alkalilenta]